jgi:beta-lactamase class A
MKLISTRRAVLRGLALIPAAAPSLWPGLARGATVDQRLAELESNAKGRLGLSALNTADGARLDYRADERFAFCSTFKIVAASALLKRSAKETDLLQQHIAITQDDLVSYSPITSKHVGEGMTVAELCAAGLQYSDNTAANLMIRLIGGPLAVTAFARSIGDEQFRLDRTETSLNTAIPGDPRDTTTPAAMAKTLKGVALDELLDPPQRAQLVDWLRGNTTGGKRIRAALPAGWGAGDKTGTGDYGTTNDVGLAWPPGKPPLVLVIYFTGTSKDAAPRDDVLASAARVALEHFGYGP